MKVKTAVDMTKGEIMMKRTCILLMVLVLLLAGCAQQAFDPSETIGVTTRESGSGTRSAFMELFEIEKIKTDAVETNNTAVMMTTVAGDRHAIGYSSLGTLGDTVKALKIDGVSATAENVRSGEYKVVRPFVLATKSDLSAAARDFVEFITSADGQQIVEQQGYIPAVANAKAYGGEVKSGKIVVGGSSSVAPLMEKLKEAYEAKNSGVTVEINQTDSSSGVADAAEGVCDIGMSSRELKDSELAKGLESTVMAQDGIAVIVNHDCPVDSLTSEQVQQIYTGELTTWSELLP